MLVRTKKSSMHKGLTSMVSWPATAVVAYLLLPVRRPVSGVDVEASVDVVPHCIQYNEGAKPRDDGE